MDAGEIEIKDCRAGQDHARVGVQIYRKDIVGYSDVSQADGASVKL